MNDWFVFVMHGVTLLQLGLAVWWCGMVSSRAACSRKEVLLALLIVLGALCLLGGDGEFVLDVPQQHFNSLVYRSIMSLWLSLRIYTGVL